MIDAPPTMSVKNIVLFSGEILAHPLTQEWKGEASVSKYGVRGNTLGERKQKSFDFLNCIRCQAFLVRSVSIQFESETAKLLFASLLPVKSRLKA